MYLAPLSLASESGVELLDQIATMASAELVALAGRFSRVFSIASPFAPGLHCVGGEVVVNADPNGSSSPTRLSIAGNGETLADALVSCLGEAAEFLSQFERPGDVGAERFSDGEANVVVDGWIGEAISRVETNIDWISAADASTGGIALLPADLCLRRPPHRRTIEPIGALSSGVAAGSNLEAAGLRAVLELCERHAAAMWWLGGRRPKRFALDHPATVAAAELIERLRQGEAKRRTLLLDITTDNGIPAVAAISVDQDGRGMAYGLSCRLSASEAAKAAILEMCQMELAAPIAEAKRTEGGDAVLNDADRRHLRRAAFAATDCELLCPRIISAQTVSGPSAATGLEGLATHLRRHGIRVFLVNHTRQDIAVSVARAVSPDLQPFSTAVSTAQFSMARRESENSDSKERETLLL
jgi:thiazole/oxazole-forming peptide maturase SagD family component